MNELTVISRSDALSHAINAIKQDIKLADSTKHKYIRALEIYTDAGWSLTSPEQLGIYCLTASESAKGFLKAGLGKVIKSELQRMNSMADPTSDDVVRLEAVMAQMSRAYQALSDSIQVNSSKGEKVHEWLSPVELKELIGKTRENGSSLVEVRDRVILGLLSNGMLRRSEAVSLKFEDIKERDGFYILEVAGKGNKTRGVKLSPLLAADIESLRQVLGDGYILRPMLKRQTQPEGYTLIGDYWVGESISSQAIYNLVAKYGGMIGKPKLQAHDLRRTGAKIAYNAKVPLDQISLSLGHSSIETTMTYIGTQRDWGLQPSDFIPY